MKLTIVQPDEETAAEKAARAEFRKSLTPIQRFTMAIGVIMLHWSYLDAEITQQIIWLKEALEEKGIDVSTIKIPGGHDQRFKLLRRLLVSLVGVDDKYVKDYDRLITIVQPATEVRHHIAHHTISFSNPTGSDGDDCLMFFSPRFSAMEGIGKEGETFPEACEGHICACRSIMGTDVGVIKNSR